MDAQQQDEDMRSPSSHTAPSTAPRASGAAPTAVQSNDVRRGAADGQEPVSPQSTLSEMSQVVAVVHHLSGRKLRAWLTQASTNVQPAFTNDYVHTNIVAGLMLADGRTVVARLPQAEAETLEPPKIDASKFNASDKVSIRSPASSFEENNLIIVQGNGTRFKTSFVGLDAVTGLSLLQVSEPRQQPIRDRGEAALTIGGRVHLFAPERVADTTKAAAVGVVYLRVSKINGQLAEIKRAAATGEVMQLGVQTDRFSPAFAGAVVTSETGKLIGIVERSDAQGVRLIPIGAVHRAATRVLTRRSSVGQPWLGARGAAVAAASLADFAARGWPHQKARSLIAERQGILLSDVAPGTPAAHAGLQAGDVIARIGDHSVRDVEDFSLMLREAGSNSNLHFTVLRAFESVPRAIVVKLSEALNPVRATEKAIAQANAQAKVTSAPLPQEAINTAAPSAMLARIGLEVAVKNAKEDADAAEQSTLAIVKVRPGSDAEVVGLRPGDEIKSILGGGGRGAHFNRQQSTAAEDRHSDDDLTFEVIRAGQRLVFKFSQR